MSLLFLKGSIGQKLRRVDSPQWNTSSEDRNDVKTGLDLIRGRQKSSSSNNNKRIWLYDSVFQTL